MEFCPRCKSLLTTREGMLWCSCGYTTQGKISLSEKIQKPPEIQVIDETTENIADSELPIVCWNCGNTGVYFWMVQMARADEAPTRFYRCKKCRKVWRSSK